MRQIYSPLEGSLSFAKKRVTDSSVNSYITMPKELHPTEEVFLDLRRVRYGSALQKQQELGHKKNLPANLEEGLKSLRERVDQVDLVPAKTDKSGKLVPCSVEAYIKMGQVHTDKDVQMESGPGVQLHYSG